MTYPNRTICGALGEMRKCFDTYNFSPVLGLIEEVQSMANRMEAALENKEDIERWTEERSKLHKEVTALRKEKRVLKLEISGEDDDDDDHYISVVDRL